MLFDIPTVENILKVGPFALGSAPLTWGQHTGWCVGNMYLSEYIT